MACLEMGTHCIGHLGKHDLLFLKMEASSVFPWHPKRHQINHGRMPIARPTTDMMKRFLILVQKERKYLLAEMVQVRGLMPLLMKRRNRQPWSEADRQELRTHLRRLRDVSPYIAVVVLPGGFAMLPVLAWWLDRRRGNRTASAA